MNNLKDKQSDLTYYIDKNQKSNEYYDNKLIECSNNITEAKQNIELLTQKNHDTETELKNQKMI